MSDLATSYSPAADDHTSYISSSQSCLCAPKQWMAHTSPLCCPKQNSWSFHPSHSLPTSPQLWSSRVILGVHGGSLVKNLPAIQEMWRCGFNSWVRKIPWRRKWLPTPVFWEIPWTEEPGGLHSMGLQRVRHDLATEHQQIYLILCGSSPDSLKKVYTAHSAWDASPSSLCLIFTSLPGGVRCLLTMCHQSAPSFPLCSSHQAVMSC